MLRTPPDVLITTPESLYLMLTSRAREFLVDAEAVIVDEIHAVARTKRGAHLALTLERLEHQAERPLQRIGLSATQRPLEEVGRFLVGRRPRVRGGGRGHPQAARREDPRAGGEHARAGRPRRDRSGARGHGHGGRRRGPGGHGSRRGAAVTQRSIWPAIYPELLRLVQEHRSTIVFVNSRRGAERLAVRLNELAGEDGEPAAIARAHHGSLAREERLVVEDLLKSGELPCLVATSSLELGIDMGAVDLVIQVESPKSVTAGPAAHRPRGPRRGRGVAGPDLPQVPRRPPRVRGGGQAHARRRHRAHRGAAQPARRAGPAGGGDRGRRRRVARGRAARPGAPRLPLLRALARAAGQRARHARRPLPERGVRRAAPADRVGPGGGHGPRAQGRPPAGHHQRGHDPRPRPLRRAPARRPAGGRAGRGDGLRGPPGPDLPPRRQHLADRGDHPRPGDRDPRPRRSRAPCPFWRGDGIGRPKELGEAIGAFSREAVDREPADLAADYDLDERAAKNLSAYLREQRDATRVVPSDRTSWWSASGTRSATGACACSLRSAAGCTRPGRWRCRRASATTSASSPTPSGPTTGSSSTFPMRTSRPRPIW